jgi:hypothetical protein
MHEQAMLEDMADVPVNRWPTLAYVNTALGLAGLGAAVILMATGHPDLAFLSAIASSGVVLLPVTFANAYYRPRAADIDESAERREADERRTGYFWGLFAALGFLALCYFVKTWPLAYDAEVVFSQSDLHATFWIALLMTQTIPEIYRVWRTQPPN